MGYTATNYNTTDYEKENAKIEAEETASLNEVDVEYGNMISGYQAEVDKGIDAAKDYADEQTLIANANTNFAIDEVERQKANAEKDYLKEQSGAYVDWQKQSNQFGANAEKMASSGMANSGYSESSLVSMYNTYQNRVATARESYMRAVTDYDNAITQARLQNSSLLAEIAYEALQTQLTLSLEAMQYKNTLLIQKAADKREIKNTAYAKWKDLLAQINAETELTEKSKQYAASYALQERAQDLAEAKFKYEKEKDASSAKITTNKGSTKSKSSSGTEKIKNYLNSVYGKPKTSPEMLKNTFKNFGLSSGLVVTTDPTTGEPIVAKKSTVDNMWKNIK